MMIEAFYQPLLVNKPAHNMVRIHAAPDELERDASLQLSILREVNLAHSAFADEGNDFVIANHLSGGESALISKIFRGDMHRWFLHEFLGAVVRLQKRF